MSLNYTTPGFDFFLKVCTYEQVSAIKEATMGLRASKVSSISFSVFNQVLNVTGAHDSRLNDSEREILFDVVSVEEGKSTIDNLEELCEYLDRYLLKQDEALHVEENNNQFDIATLKLGFDSDTDGDPESPRDSGGFTFRDKDSGKENEEDEDTPNAITGSEKMLLNMEENIKEAMQYLSKAVSNIGESMDSEKLSKRLKTSMEYVSEVGAKLNSINNVIDSIRMHITESDRKVEVMEHRVRSIELELRNQGEIADSIREENAILRDNFNTINTGEDKIDELRRRLDDRELEFAKERSLYNARIKDLEFEVSQSNSKLSTTIERLRSAEENVEMISKLKEENEIQCLESTDKQAVQQLRTELSSTKAELKSKNIHLDKELKRNDEFYDQIKQLRLQVNREEAHKEVLKEEINILKNEILDLEERFNKERIEGNAHIGLSKIDFQPNRPTNATYRNAIERDRNSGILNTSFNSGAKWNKNLLVPNGNDDSFAKDSVILTRAKMTEDIEEVSQRFESSDLTNERSKLTNALAESKQSPKEAEVDRFSIRSTFQVGMNNISVFMGAQNIQEFSLYKDYLNISFDKRISDMLISEGEDSLNGQCLSDFVYVMGNGSKRIKKKIIITSERLFIVNCNKKSKLDRVYALEELSEVIVSAKNYSLCAFMFKEGLPLLIDSYRRLDIIMYTAILMKNLNSSAFKVVFLKKFIFKQKNKPEVILKYPELGKSIQIAMLQETLRNSRRSGYLKLRRKGLFGSYYTEFFFILSNIGLLYFKSFGVRFS